MSEEKQNLQRQADRVKPGSKRSVLTYMTILFVAAFFMLLLAYFMQQRNAEETIDGLKSSMSAMQTAQEVYEENAALKEQLNSLEDELQAAQNQIGALEQENSLLQQEKDDLTLTGQAMDWFWQINEAYVRGRKTLCRQLIESLNSAGLADYLPRQSITDNERFSPYDRYQEIYEALY